MMIVLKHRSLKNVELEIGQSIEALAIPSKKLTILAEDQMTT